MKIFSFFKWKKHKNIEEQRYIMFEKWLDQIISKDMSDDIIAYYFCLYEGCRSDSQSTYIDIELIGTDEFDEEDEDWGCSEVYFSRPNFCEIRRTSDIEHWEEAEKMCVAIVNRYLDNGQYANKLKSVQGVGVGFNNGSIVIVYNKNTQSI